MNSLSNVTPNACAGLEPCFALQTMLAGYEDSMLCSHVRPACGRALSGLRPSASKLCSQDMRIARSHVRRPRRTLPNLRPSACGSVGAAGRRRTLPGVRPCKRGEPAAVPYPGERGRRASAAGLRPYLIPACVRASAAGLRPYLAGLRRRLHAVQVSLKGGS